MWSQSTHLPHGCNPGRLPQNRTLGSLVVKITSVRPSLDLFTSMYSGLSASRLPDPLRSRTTYAVTFTHLSVLFTQNTALGCSTVLTSKRGAPAQDGGVHSNPQRSLQFPASHTTSVSTGGMHTSTPAQGPSTVVDARELAVHRSVLWSVLRGSMQQLGCVMYHARTLLQVRLDFHAGHHSIQLQTPCCLVIDSNSSHNEFQKAKQGRNRVGREDVSNRNLKVDAGGGSAHDLSHMPFNLPLCIPHPCP